MKAAWWQRLCRKEAPHLRTGRWGERMAERLLRRQGYRILGRRVRLHRHEEIDLVARRDDVLVFVEVKTRSGGAIVRPARAVNHAKRRRLTRAAARYLARIRKRPAAFRYDIIEVIGSPGEGRPIIRHIEGAFTSRGGNAVQWP